MTTEEMFQKLDGYFQRRETDQVEPFLLSCLEEAKEKAQYGLYISVANELIGFYRSVTQFSKAFDISEDVLLLMEELQLDQTEHFATTLLNVATACRAAGKQAEACRYYRQALQIYERALEPGDYRFAGLYNNLGILLENMGEKEEAAAVLEKALEIVTPLQGSEMEQAITRTNLAMVFFQSDQNEKAEEQLRRAIQLFEQRGEETDPHYSAALAGMGEAAFRRADFTAALSCYEKALAELSAHFGENMSYALLCDNCAAVCERMGDLQKKQFYEQKSKEVKQKFETDEA